MKSDIMLLDCYNHKLHTEGVIGTVVPHFGRWGTTNGWKIIEIIDKNNENYGTEREQTDIELAG